MMRMGALPPEDSKMAIREMKLTFLRRVIGSMQFLVDHPEAQTRRTIATNEIGQTVEPTDPNACQWCALGRIAHDFDIRSDGGIRNDGLVNMQPIYNTIGKLILNPLGLSTTTFIHANDILIDPAGRQHELEFLLATLKDRLRDMEATARAAA